MCETTPAGRTAKPKDGFFKPRAGTWYGEMMAKGRVLLIAEDDWEAALLVKSLADEGYEVSAAHEARAGFDKVRELEPDCILCSVTLPDIDGFWVARRVRAEHGRVRTAPFLFLIDAEDVQGRLQGFNVGADLFVVKPFRVEEVVAQINALIEMARRLTATPPALDAAAVSDVEVEPPSSIGPNVIQGDVAQMSITTVLTLLELERRTGRLKVRGPNEEEVRLELRDGELVSATLGDSAVEPEAILRDMLRWNAGSFQFRSVEVAPGSEARNVSGLLLNIMTLEDETNRPA